MTSQSPGWAEKLKGQTIVEDASEGLDMFLPSAGGQMGDGGRLRVEQWTATLFPVGAMGVSAGIAEHGSNGFCPCPGRCPPTSRLTLRSWERHESFDGGEVIFLN